MKSKSNEITTMMTFAIIAIFCVIFSSAIWFWVGYFDGILINWIFGEWVVKAFAALHIEIDRTQIPLIFALIGLVASFFRTNPYNKNKD